MNEVMVDGKAGDDHVSVRVYNPTFAVSIADSSSRGGSRGDTAEVMDLTGAGTKLDRGSVQVGSGTGNVWIGAGVEAVAIKSAGDKIQKFDIATSTWSELSITTDPENADYFDEARARFLSVQRVAKVSDNRVFVMFRHDVQVVGDDSASLSDFLLGRG